VGLSRPRTSTIRILCNKIPTIDFNIIIIKVERAHFLFNKQTLNKSNQIEEKPAFSQI